MSAERSNHERRPGRSNRVGRVRLDRRPVAPAGRPPVKIVVDQSTFESLVEIEDRIARLGGTIDPEYIAEAAVDFLVTELGLDGAAREVKRWSGQ